jgi:hypothetical protein
MAQALQRIGESLDFLSDGIRETINKRYSSEVEVTGEGGILQDVIYSGPETSTTTTTLGNALEDLSAGSNATIRTRVEFSNEDAAKQSTETLQFSF